MDFYYTAGAANCRSVSLFAKALDLKLNKHPINLQQQEQLKPEYVKINPQHTVPTLVDNGYALWESRAILIYLAEKYDKNHTYYPTNPEKRGLINQRMYFDMGVLYHRYAEYFYPQFRDKQPADPEKLKKLEEGLGFLNIFLEGQKFAVGDSLTLADFPLLATISTIEVSGIDISKFINVERWYQNVKKVTPGWDESWEELLVMKKRLEELMKK